MNKPTIHRYAVAYRYAVAFALVSLCACTGLKDTGVSCRGSFRPIHEIQGPDAASPRSGERVTVRGVVVGDYRGRDQLAGFFLQAPLADEDPRTSEGLFVHARRGAALAAGDLVQVSGRVEEAGGLTGLTDVEGFTVCGSGASPGPVPLSLIEVDDLEPYEGMLVTLVDDLFVAGNHELGLHGQLLLAAGTRPFKHTHGRGAPEKRQMGRRLLLDDGSTLENPATPPYLDAAGTRRAGDAVSGLIGVLSEHQGSHVLHPTATPRFTGGNPRVAEPPPVAGTVKVASFNLLNFFTSLGERGASNPRELERQRAKLVAAISSLDADVMGLNELENNGETAIRDLVDALNAVADPAAPGPDRWAHVPDPAGGLGDDGIRVGLIYRPATVRAVGPAKVDRDPVFKRPPFAQTFETRGERFTVVVNHFKSKSCRGAIGAESDAGDGQGCWNPLRVAQARRLSEFVSRLQAESDDADVLVIGDLNAYGAEDPIQALTESGLRDQIAAHVPPAERYSFVYRGQAGYLDHALTTPSLDGRVTGATIWHINADEPTFLDYKVRPMAPGGDIVPSAPLRGDIEHRRPDLYRPDPYRSSDHDPVLIGLEF